MADDDLTRLDEWFGQILQGLAPAERRRAAMKLGQALRRSNLKRISSNTNPDGTPFEPRKARYDRKGRLRMKAGAKMFRGLRMAKQWKIDADQDGVELSPVSPVAARMGRVSQFGETITVGRLRNGKRIRARYPERRLLGHSDEDEDLAMLIAAEMIEPD
jgi:phage virion morphogenesis (putative tail completion) protein